MYAILQTEGGVSRATFGFHIMALDHELDLQETVRLRLIGLCRHRSDALRVELLFHAELCLNPEAKFSDKSVQPGRCQATLLQPGSPGHRTQGRPLDLEPGKWCTLNFGNRLRLDSIELGSAAPEQTEPRYVLPPIPQPPSDGRCGRDEIDVENGNFVL
jgi:hypothetical protein